MKRLMMIAVSATIAFSAFPAAAQDSKTDAIEELLLVSKTQKLMVDGMILAFDALVQQSGPVSPEDREAVDQVFVEMRQLLAAEGETFVDAFVPIYATHMEEDDIRALTAFYSTDAGQRVLAALPLIMAEGAVMGQEWQVQMMQTKLPGLLERLDQILQ